MGDLGVKASETTAGVTSLREYYALTRKAESSVTLEWKDVSYSTWTKDPVRKCMVKKQILQSVTGAGKSGELIAIMGPTGCGKTSLMNILAARVPSGGAELQHLSGIVNVNGRLRNESLFRSWSAYVLQDDFLYCHLTVHETLLLAAHFFLPTHMPLLEKLNLIDLVIAELGLKKARDTIIGDDKQRGVSGGERKRTAIASQIITDPAVLFLDEPTSGLDSFQALSVMECMRDLSQNGRLVISVIHQPRSSIYNMFDKLLLLSEGRTMFYGKASEAIDHFAFLGFNCPKSFNPADFFLDVLSPDCRTEELEVAASERISRLDKKWQEKEAGEVGGRGGEGEGEGEKEDDGPRPTATANDPAKVGNSTDLTKLSRNMLILCWRAWTEQSRDILTQSVKCAVTVFFALVLGGIYSNVGLGQKSIQNRNGLLFFVGINQGFNGLIGVLTTFPKEKSIVNRERAGRAYDTASYFFAKLFVEIPLNVLPSIIFSCIIYWMVGLNPDRFGEFIGISMLVTITAIALGLAVSAAVPTVEAANAVGPPLMVIGILFGGFYIDIDSLPPVANWIPYFSFLRWSFQAYAINEYKGLIFNCVGAAEGACRKTGEEVLISLSFDGHSTAYPVFGMGMVLLAFVAIAYTILHNSKAKYTPMGWKGAKFKALAADQAGGGAGGAVLGGAVVAVVEVADEVVGVQMKEQP